MRVLVALIVAAAGSLAADPPAPTGRALRILSASSAQWERREGVAGMRINVLVETDGCEGRDVQAAAWLHGPDGTPLRAAPGAPEALVDDEGSVRVGATMRSPRARGSVTPFELFVPYAAMVPPPAQERRVVVVVRAGCEGMHAMATFGDHLPPLTPPIPAPGLRIESVSVAPAGAGEWSVDVRFAGASAAQGALDAAIRLRTPTGTFIRAAADAPRQLRGPEGEFECRTRVPAEGEPRARLRIPLGALDLEPGKEHTLLLTTFASRDGWRAIEEREIVIGTAAAPPPPEPPLYPPEEAPGMPPPVAPPARVEVEVLEPTVALLLRPYVGRAGSHGLQSNLLAVEARVRGLPEGLHALCLDLGASGRRFLWTRVDAGAPEVSFDGLLPIPAGSFRAVVSVPGASTTIEGRMEPDPWAPLGDDLQSQLRSIEKRQIEGDLYALALAQVADGYLLRGDVGRAEEIAERCVALCAGTRGATLPEAEQQARRVLASARLLSGDLKGVDEVYRAWLDRAGDVPATRATLLREWADLVALLSDDPERARALWSDASAAAAKAGLPAPPTPPYAR